MLLAGHFFARHRLAALLVILLGVAAASPAPAAEGGRSDGLDFARLAAIRTVGDTVVSPDGRQIAYVLQVPREPGEDEDGSAWRELHLVGVDGGSDRPFVHGEVRVSRVRFTPDGRLVTYLAKRDGDEHTTVWAVPVDGGESWRLVEHDASVSDYRVAPDGTRIAFSAHEPESKEQEKLEEKGYKQEVFEEDWRPRRLWIAPLPPLAPPVEDPSAVEKEEEDEEEKPAPLEIDGSLSGFDWSPDGKRLAVAVAPTPSVDDRYMFRKIRIVDAGSGKSRAVLENPGKLGKFLFSPDGRYVAMISGADANDPSAGRLLIGPAAGGPLRDLLPGLEAHVRDIAWQDARTVMLLVDEGVETWFGEVDLESGARKIHHRSGSGAPLLLSLSLSADGRVAVFGGETPQHPREVFALAHGQRQARRLTRSNPWLDGVALAEQQVYRWEARDGVALEGILLRPLESPDGPPAPLLLMVHGGPESHVRNGWVTSYSRPAQLAAARGYAVLFPNYRGSTGRGVAFSKSSQADAAGKEFDDLIDAVDQLVAEGLTDRSRVGISGGSYGGYATAWCSTRYTDRFRAGVMFVGVSNKLSKGLTTEIPNEDRMVHTLTDPWTRWQFSLERSPLYHVEKSRTALLIAGGTADKRVHPSQSLQLYRALKLIGKTPVRYVRYPGEGHGNTKAAARDDFARRLMRWMDHFVQEGRDDLPPWEIDYGLGDDDEASDDDSTADQTRRRFPEQIFSMASSE